MKNKNLNMLIKASVKTRKFSSGLFMFFIILATTLIFISVGIVAPLWYNIDTKINNHILNREVTLDYSPKISDEDIKADLKFLKSDEHIIDIYMTPKELSVTDGSGALASNYTVNYVHKYYTPEMAAGRAFTEDETSVAIVPSTIKDYNGEKGKIEVINGADLVGKTLVLSDTLETTHKFKVVGAYDVTDPMFEGTEILIPQAQLLEWDDEFLNNPDSAFSSMTDRKFYTMVVDSPSYTDTAVAKAEDLTTAYSMGLGIDTDSYNTAFYIIFAVTIFCIFLSVFGLYIFLKMNVNLRTQEFALYRAVGFKSKNIYYIILIEHLILGLVSIALGVAITCLANTFAVNPYLYSLVGNTFMEMEATINLPEILAVLAGYIAVLLIVCINAVKRSEKIDLTILLRAS
jgi:ABC-type antimicrobial peptide transport system permease subunit